MSQFPPPQPPHQPTHQHPTNLPGIDPDIQLSASFSDTSSSSQGQLLNMSDINALCDRDARLTIPDIKQMFKGLVDKISQIQLGMAIKQGNLKMSDQNQKVKQKGKDIGKAKEKEKDDKKQKQKKNKRKSSNQSGNKSNQQFNINIQQKQQKPLVKRGSVKQKAIQIMTRRKTKSRSRQGQRERKSSKEKQRIENQLLQKLQKQQFQDKTSQLTKRVQQLEKQIQKIKNLLKQKQILIQFQKSNQNQKQQKQQKIQSKPISNLVSIQQQKDIKNIIQQLNVQQNKFPIFDTGINNKYFEIDEKNNGRIATYIGNNNQDALLFINSLKFDTNNQYTIKILKTSQRNILVGLANQKYRQKRCPTKDDNMQSIFYHGNVGTIVQNCKLIKQQWNGFAENDIIQVKIQRKDKINGNSKYKLQIQWIINGIVRATYSSQNIDKEQNQLVPCVVLCNTGDSIKIK